MTRKRVDYMGGLPRKHTIVVMCRPTEPQRILVTLLQPMVPSAALMSLGLIRTALYDPEVRAAPPLPPSLLSRPRRRQSPRSKQELCGTAYGSRKLRHVFEQSPERPAEQMGALPRRCVGPRPWRTHLFPCDRSHVLWQRGRASCRRARA